MAKKVLLTARDLIEFVQGALGPYIGIAAEVADHRPMVEVVLDLYCFGQNIKHRKTVREMASEYSVPTDIAVEIEETLTRTLLTVIQNGFGLIYPSRFYRYHWFNEGDIIIEEFAAKPADFEDEPLDIELVLDPAEDGSFDTGFTPERLRRG